MHHGQARWQYCTQVSSTLFGEALSRLFLSSKPSVARRRIEKEVNIPIDYNAQLKAGCFKNKVTSGDTHISYNFLPTFSLLKIGAECKKWASGALGSFLPGLKENNNLTKTARGVIVDTSIVPGSAMYKYRKSGTSTVRERFLSLGLQLDYRCMFKLKCFLNFFTSSSSQLTHISLNLLISSVCKEEVKFTLGEKFQDK